jgi:hypothetical protein
MPAITQVISTGRICSSPVRTTAAPGTDWLGQRRAVRQERGHFGLTHESH